MKVEDVGTRAGPLSHKIMSGSKTVAHPASLFVLATSCLRDIQRAAAAGARKQHRVHRLWHAGRYRAGAAAGSSVGAVAMAGAPSAQELPGKHRSQASLRPPIEAGRNLKCGSTHPARSHVNRPGSAMPAAALFCWPPGHTVQIDQDAEAILLSPRHRYSHAIAHMIGSVRQAAQAARQSAARAVHGGTTSLQAVAHHSRAPA